MLFYTFPYLVNLCAIYPVYWGKLGWKRMKMVFILGSMVMTILWQRKSSINFTNKSQGTQWKNGTKIIYKEDQTNQNGRPASLRIDNENTERVNNFFLFWSTINNKGASKKYAIF